jgi:hypothetical protein
LFSGCWKCSHGLSTFFQASQCNNNKLKTNIDLFRPRTKQKIVLLCGVIAENAWARPQNNKGNFYVNFVTYVKIYRKPNLPSAKSTWEDKSPIIIRVRAVAIAVGASIVINKWTTISRKRNDIITAFDSAHEP